MVSVDVKTILGGWVGGGGGIRGVCVCVCGAKHQHYKQQKATLVHADAVPRTIEDRKLFKKNVDSHLKTHRNQHRRRR